jgi:hypothetical protein
MTTSTFPEITVGPWTWGEEEGGGDPALRYRGTEIRAGAHLTAAELRLAALDLMKLAAAVAAHGQNPPAP